METPLETTKGYLFNLIIYTREFHRFHYFHRKVEELIKNFPCRAIFVCNEKRDFLITENKAAIIQVPPSCLEKVPYLVLPRLIPDLPVYLLWGDDPTHKNGWEEKAILERLQRIATRLIFDPETADNLQLFSQEMIKKCDTVELMDLDWAKIGGWRDVIYQVFSSSQQQEQLNQCNTITIKYNCRKNTTGRHSATQAIYLQGWIAAQLNWAFHSINTDTFSLMYDNNRKKPIKVELLAQEKTSLPQGQIFEIEIKNTTKTTLTLIEKQSKVMVYHSETTYCELPFSLHIPNLQKGTNLVKELFYYLPTSHYKNMLKMISSIHWETVMK